MDSINEFEDKKTLTMAKQSHYLTLITLSLTFITWNSYFFSFLGSYRSIFTNYFNENACIDYVSI